MSPTEAEEGELEILRGDLVLLEQLDENGITDALKERIAKNQIYTYIGSGAVLISVNPFKEIPGLYGVEQIPKYRHRFAHEAVPHVFALAEAAYRDIVQAPQCVIICGESGSGKTEASKKVMQYIAAVSGDSPEIVQVKDYLLKSNPVLEAFGNAKTIRNNNSSRFGKYLEIFFDFRGDPIGGDIKNYLLEKSRVVNPGVGERSFHIFYQLLRGIEDDTTRERLRLLTDLKDYVFLSKSGTFEIDDDDTTSKADLIGYKETIDAMKALSISDVEINDVMSTLSGILWLGNIEFTAEEDLQSVVSEASMVALENASALFQVSKEQLAKCFVQRENESSKETITRFHMIEEARFTRDAFAKTVYMRLFDWIVQKVNSAIALSPSTQSMSSIGVLDIYGFEIFESNSFEQFCINYANEKLQQIFIERTLKLEQEEYARENIKWTSIDYFNNKIVCELIESKNSGIIALLNEACLVPKGSDELFHSSIVHQFGNHPHFIKPDSVKQSITSFTIKHYAGIVEYDTYGFLDKNKDLLWKDLLLLGEGSKLALFKDLFPKGGAAELGVKRPETASTQFRFQVSQLMDLLSKCRPHYIRCIKPNDIKKPNVFDSERVLHQVRYLGLLENVKVRRAGFAFRQPYEEFLKRYKLVCPKTWPTWDSKKAKEGVLQIMESENIPEGHGYQLGLSKIFVKEPKTMFALEKTRIERLKLVLMRVQNKLKSLVFVSMFRDYRASRLLQSWHKSNSARIEFKKYKAARSIQSVLTGRKMLKWFSKMQAATQIQKFIRSYKEVNSMKIIKAFKVIQGFVIGAKEAHTYKCHCSARTIQQVFRSKLVQRDYLASTLAVALQRVYQHYLLRKPGLLLRKQAKSLIGEKKLRRRVSLDLFPLGVYCPEIMEDNLLLSTLKPFGESEVIFADRCFKFGAKCVPRRRYIVLTNKSFYDFEFIPTKKKKTLRLHYRLMLVVLKSVTLSSYADNFLILHFPTQFDVVYSVERKTEFLTALSNVWQEVNKKALEIEFSNDVCYIAKWHKPMQIIFHDPDEPISDIPSSRRRSSLSFSSSANSRRGSTLDPLENDAMSRIVRESKKCHVYLRFVPLADSTSLSKPKNPHLLDKKIPDPILEQGEE